MKGDKSDTGGSDRNPPESYDYSPGPASAAAYIPPTRAPKESKYHTLDLKAVRLSPEIDPQRMKTQMALRRLPAGSHAAASPTMWVTLCLAGAALGLGAWWCLQWWREPDVSPVGLLGRDALPSIVLAIPPAPLVSTNPRAATAVSALSAAPSLVLPGLRVVPPASSSASRPVLPRPLAGAK